MTNNKEDKKFHYIPHCINEYKTLFDQMKEGNLIAGIGIGKHSRTMDSRRGIELGKYNKKKSSYRVKVLCDGNFQPFYLTVTPWKKEEFNQLLRGIEGLVLD